MTDGFIKTAAGTIDVQVADVQTNTDTILARVRQADAAGVDLLPLPDSVQLSTDLASALEGREVIVISIGAQGLRAVAQ